MALLHAYENNLIRKLPPNAQHAAEALLAKSSLKDLMLLREEANIDLLLMDQSKVPHALWPEIVRAVLLARVTYFEPSPLLDQEKILLLVRTAIETIGFSVATPLPTIVNSIKLDYPRLTRWLSLMAQQLVKIKASAAENATG